MALQRRRHTALGANHNRKKNADLLRRSAINFHNSQHYNNCLSSKLPLTPVNASELAREYELLGNRKKTGYDRQPVQFTISHKMKLVRSKKNQHESHYHMYYYIHTYTKYTLEMRLMTKCNLIYGQ